MCKPDEKNCECRECNCKNEEKPCVENEEKEEKEGEDQYLIEGQNLFSIRNYKK